MMYKSQFRKIDKTGFVVQGHILPGEDLKNTYRLHVSSIKFYACYSA